MILSLLLSALVSYYPIRAHAPLLMNLNSISLGCSVLVIILTDGIVKYGWWRARALLRLTLGGCVALVCIQQLVFAYTTVPSLVPSQILVPAIFIVVFVPVFMISWGKNTKRLMSSLSDAEIVRLFPDCVKAETAKIVPSESSLDEKGEIEGIGARSILNTLALLFLPMIFFYACIYLIPVFQEQDRTGKFVVRLVIYPALQSALFFILRKKAVDQVINCNCEVLVPKFCYP